MAAVRSFDDIRSELRSAISQLRRAHGLVVDAQLRERVMRDGLYTESAINTAVQAILDEAEDIADKVGTDLGGINYQHQIHVKIRPKTGYTALDISNSGVFGVDSGAGTDALDPFGNGDVIQMRNTEDAGNENLEFTVSTSDAKSLAAASTVSGAVVNSDDESVELVLVER